MTNSYKRCPLSRSFPCLHNSSQTSCGNWLGGLIAKTPVGPPESAPRPRCESSSRAVSLSRFLNAFIALLSTCGVMPPPCPCCSCSVIICLCIFAYYFLIYSRLPRHFRFQSKKSRMSSFLLPSAHPFDGSFCLYKKSPMLLALMSRICKLRVDVKREFSGLGENCLAGEGRHLDSRCFDSAQDRFRGNDNWWGKGHRTNFKRLPYPLPDRSRGQAWRGARIRDCVAVPATAKRRRGYLEHL